MNTRAPITPDETPKPMASGASTCSPCPFCGEMDKLVVDCSSLVTSQLGIDYQSGNVDCESCGAAGPYVHARGRETDRLIEMIWEAWNHRENSQAHPPQVG